MLPNQAQGKDSNTGGWSYTGWWFIGGLTTAPSTAGKSSEISPTVHSMLEVAAYRDMGYSSLGCTVGSDVFQYSLTDALEAGANWLLNRRQNPDGSFGTPGQPHTLDTALAYLAVARVRPQDASLSAAHDYLLSQQASDGSWQGDAFVTATVLKALGGPVLMDADLDGIPDAVEVVLGSNPKVPDSRGYAGRNGQSEPGVTSPTIYLTTLNRSFSTSLASSPGPLTGGVVIGELPEGLSLDTTTGTLSGTPTSSGYYNFTFQYIDSNGVTHSALIQIGVGAPDTTAPIVTGRTPFPGATSVDTDSLVTASFSEPVSPASVNPSTFELRDAANQLVPATILYDAANLTATLIPSGGLAVASSYTVTLAGGNAAARVQDTSGNALAADVSWTFTTNSGPQCPCSVWDDSTIPAQQANDAGSIELGVKFRTSANGYITGVRFYKAAGNTGAHTGTLWSATGQVLASAVFTNETPTGWQQVNFSTPVPVTAGTVYVASYHAPNGHYAYEHDFFLSAGVGNGPLYLLRDGESGANGLFSESPSVSFPTSSYRSSNYSVDVVFEPSSSEPQCPCSVWDASTVPTQSAENDSSSIELGVKFRTSVDGFVTGVRFYKAVGNTGTHTGSVWSASGQLLGSAIFTNETASGWQQVTFSTPIAVSANTVYVASYHAPNGHYMYEHDFYLSSGSSKGPLQFPRDGESGGNGLYTYGTGVVFPNSTHRSSNY